MSRQIVITCGGTGGHIYPAIAIAQALPKEDVVFIGSQERLETNLIPEEGFRLISIPVKRTRNPLSIFYSFVRALLVLRKINPDYIVSTGGYVTLPVCMAAIVLRKKIVLQEQNTIPGKTNRLIGLFAYRIALGLPTRPGYFNPAKTTLTGNPVRKKFFDDNNQSFLKGLALPKEAKTILVLGGSQGAETLNTAIYSMLKEKTADQNTTFILIAGKNNFAKSRGEFLGLKSTSVIKETTDFVHISTADGQQVYLFSYLHRINAVMKAADLIIARAGASTITEIMALGKPSILVPYPYAADNHQLWNARYMSDNGCALLILNSELSGKSLTGIINSLSADKLKEMGRCALKIFNADSAQKIVDLLK